MLMADAYISDVADVADAFDVPNVADVNNVADVIDDDAVADATADADKTTHVWAHPRPKNVLVPFFYILHTTFNQIRLIRSFSSTDESERPKQKIIFFAACHSFAGLSVFTSGQKWEI